MTQQVTSKAYIRIEVPNSQIRIGTALYQRQVLLIANMATSDFIACLSRKITVALFAIIAFSFVKFSYGQFCLSDEECESFASCCRKRCIYASNCLYQSCSKNSDCSANQACCDSFCVKGSSCLGQFCSTNLDCSEDQTCCNDKCVQGNTCVGQKCIINYDCSVGQTCCTGKCKDGLGCIGEPCLEEYGDCQDLEHCCKGTCSKEDCATSIVFWPYIIVAVAALVIALIITAIMFFRQRQRQLLLMGASVPANILANSTIPSATISVTQCNPLYQPQGPPSYQPTEQPPAYPATPTNQGFGGMNTAPQTDPFASAAER
ncbi:keratin-associated protein 10-5-like [Montipora capricornis]|uniref:keratin-associated protein 10-5-like n=1 Tax=Montipora foliosa TaxID=591990 RepID=UPI0035F1BFC1